MIKQYFTITFLLLLILSACKNNDDSCPESVWYENSDNDGFGNENVVKSSCIQPENFVSNSDDIDDNNAGLNPNTVWQGNKIIFQKEDAADWTLEANQDRITNEVWITRANNKGLFNIALEASSNSNDLSGTSPINTEWAMGTIAEGIENLTFTTWAVAMDECPPCQVDKNFVVHLISDNIYIDIKLTSWTQGNSGGQGGFSYERSTMN